jgi:hypothetical protein
MTAGSVGARMGVRAHGVSREAAAAVLVAVGVPLAVGKGVEPGVGVALAVGRGVELDAGDGWTGVETQPTSKLSASRLTIQASE